MYNLKNQLIDIGLCEDNSYLDKYCELIFANRPTEKISHKTQQHHVIPRFYFKLNSIPIDNSDKNKVNLLHKDHVLAHYYLALCSANNQFKNNNIFAIKHVLGNSIYKKLDTYLEEKAFLEQLEDYQSLMELNCKAIGDIHRGKIESEETRKKKSISHLGLKYKIMSEQGRKNISEAKKGKSHIVYEETREKVSKTRLNLKLVNIHKDNDKRSVPESELDEWLLKGYTKGWGNQFKEPMKHMNDGNKEKLIPQSECQSYVDMGWKYGRSPDFLEAIRKATRKNMVDFSLRIWVNNGLINKRVTADNIPEGFVKGRLKFKNKL